MTEYLLKRALPFTLTFIIGAAVGGFFHLFAARDTARRAARYTYTYEGGRGCANRFRRHAAPDSRPPVILSKLEARFPQGLDWEWGRSGVWPWRVRVTLGEDGKVREVSSVDRWSREVSAEAERVARQIQFIPATRGGAPTTVTEEVSILFSFE